MAQAYTMVSMTFDAEATTPPTPIKRRGNSRYVLLPKDWPADAQVRVILLPRP
jgi:hypothetical protein